MTKSMKNENHSFIEGRRSFLKGTAYSVAGATLAAGVFETVAATPATAETKFTATPATLTNDGFTLTLGGAPAAGEITVIRPTRMAAKTPGYHTPGHLSYRGGPFSQGSTRALGGGSPVC